MKACLDCRIKFKDDSRTTCPKCGGTNIKIVTNGKIVNTPKVEEKADKNKGSKRTKKEEKQKIRKKQEVVTIENDDNVPVILDITFGEWFIYMIKMMIPVFGTFFMIRHAIGSPKDSQTKTNLCRAYVVIFLIQMATLVGLLAATQRLQAILSMFS